MTIQRSAESGIRRKPAWLAAFRRFLLFVVLANLAWEFAHLPLYTIWSQGTAREIAFAALHCTGGDVLIAAASLLGALIVAGNGRWPYERYGRVGVLAVVAGLGLTIFIEWLNTEVRGAWAYTDFMPTLPWVGTGLSPLAQWIVIPAAALWWARRGALEEIPQEECA